MNIPKVTPVIRRLLVDPDFYRAMQCLIGAQDALRALDHNRKPLDAPRPMTKASARALAIRESNEFAERADRWCKGESQ